MSYLNITDLEFSYKDKIIFSNLNISAEKGEFISVVGPSGCGKSTLLNILAGTIKANGGSITVDNDNVVGLNTHFAYMPQDDLLLNWKTVKQNITLYQQLHSLHIDDASIDEHLENFGLLAVKNNYPDSLSGGMKQRVALLRTVFVNRDILLLDEPFGALDIFTRQHLQDWLKDLTNSLGKTILLVTHDVDEALYLSDKVYVMGNTPATMIDMIDLKGIDKSREWLMKQDSTKKIIFDKLRPNDFLV